MHNTSTCNSSSEKALEAGPVLQMHLRKVMRHETCLQSMFHTGINMNWDLVMHCTDHACSLESLERYDGPSSLASQLKLKMIEFLEKPDDLPFGPYHSLRYNLLSVRGLSSLDLCSISQYPPRTIGRQSHWLCAITIGFYSKHRNQV